MSSLIVGVVAYGNSPSPQGRGKSVNRDSVVKRIALAELTVRGTIQETVLLGSAGLPAGTPIRAAISCTWSSSALQGVGCQKANPVYEHSLQYVAPEPRNAIDYTPEGHLIVHRWATASVLNTAQGVFLIEDWESSRIAPSHEIVASSRSRTVTAWRTQAIFWAEAVQIATGRIPLMLAEAITQTLPQNDGTMLVQIQDSRLPHGWRLYLNPQEHWLIRRAEAIGAGGEVLFTLETHGALRNPQSDLVIAAGAQARIGGHTITIRFTECAAQADRELLKQLQRRAQDPNATHLDYRVGGVKFPDGQPIEPRP
ncbi:MAG: hypothetical protein NZM28_06335 [Fimbriimonadales bacterium]|nr:hypothetical protein [Fimbriimonadales bacterium]